MRPFLRWLLIASTLLAVLIAVTFAAFSLWKGRVDRQLDAAWRRSLGGPSFLERYPKCDDNATVHELEALGATIGIDMAPSEAKGRSRPTPEAVRRFAAVKPLLKELFEHAAQAEDGTLAPPPPAVATYLEEARPTLRRVVELLRRDPPPVWRRDLGLAFDAPLPNLLGVLLLQRVLLLDARERLRGGQLEEALPILEASWRYNAATQADSPSLVSQLIAIAVLKQQQPLLRNLPAISTAQVAAAREWRAQMDGIAPRDWILVGLHSEAAMSYRASTLDRPLGREGTAMLQHSWVRLLIWDHARRFEAMIQELPRRDVRTFDGEAFGREMQQEIPRWQMIARILLPNFWDAWGKAARAELAVDLTGRVLEEQERLAAGGPPHRGERRPSRIRGLSWIYDETPEGTLIHLDGDLLYKDPKPMPLRFLVRRPARG